MNKVTQDELDAVKASGRSVADYVNKKLGLDSVTPARSRHTQAHRDRLPARLEQLRNMEIGVCFYD